MLLAAGVLRRSPLLPTCIALLSWVQLGVVVIVCWPWLTVPDAPPLFWTGFVLDGTSSFFLVLTTLVSAAALTQSLGVHPGGGQASFYAAAALFLLSMSAAVASNDLGYLWISMEATTLASAPLVAWHRDKASVEAAWKYLIICSVGIGFAFFGTALLYSASQGVIPPDGSLSLTILRAHAQDLPPAQLRLAFLFILLGYGTKAGLFPLHNWLPDAHSEAPAPASAMLSGAMLNCALLPLWRCSGLLEAAGAGSFLRITLWPMGVLTVVAASLFLLRQQDLKRLLAYSSMENVGMMTLAIAVGSSNGFGLQAINHSLVKVALFLLAGNLLAQYDTKRIRSLRGVLQATPLQGALLLCGALAVVGTPPFGSFAAEWQILAAMLDHGHLLAVVVVSLSLAVAFVAMCLHVCQVLFGDRLASAQALSRGVVVVPFLLIAGSLVLGIMVPGPLLHLLQELPR
jgi:hydrogenase-4 component F